MKKIFIILLATIVFVHPQSRNITKQLQKDGTIKSDQLKNIAIDKGMTEQQIESAIKKGDINLDNEEAKENQLQDPFEVIEMEGVKYIKDGLRYIPIIGNKQTTLEPTDEDEISVTESIYPKPMDELSYFGYQIFSGDPESFQASTFGAVDPDYIIGHGDQIIVMLWGESQFRLEFKIDNEGYVFIPEVGQVSVNGLNLEALEKKLFQIFSKVYSTLNPSTGKPSTFMDISLGNLRPLRIIVLGEVAQPGAYSVSPSTSLFSSLYYFQGPTTRGSLRDIRLLRKGKQIGSIDFYDYLLSGKSPDDLRLQLDDVVFVPPRGKTVTIKGEVNRQGIYELKKEEGLKDLLHFAGDLPVTAYMNRAQINRIVPVNDRSELGMDRMVIDIDLKASIDDNKNTEIRDRDDLEIFSIEDMEKNYVIIHGSSVNRPGRYQLLPEMRVSGLIKNSEGLISDAYLEIAHIIRINDDLTPELISINLKKAISGDLKNNIKLQFMDELTVYNKNILKNIFGNVTISGPVKYPGSFTLKKDQKLGDMIIAAGGFNSDIQKVKIIIARQNPNSFEPIVYNFPSSSNKYFKINQLDNDENEVNQFILKKNDIISIYADPRDELSEMAHISGAVYFPGSYPIISKNQKVTDVIIQAGGLLPDAYPMASTFIRNSQAVRLSFEEIIDNPNSRQNFTLMPGDSIEILKKSNIVKILGEVNNPGLFKYYNNTSLRNYINIAGGFTVNAEPKEIWLTYPDGTSRQLKPFYPSPKVYDGTVITVGKQEETEPLDKTEFLKEMASIISDFLQIALTLALLSNTSAN